ncbi:MAG TPA: hypothetical protein DD640_08085 [Clostridiales bacterium]|nr:hypothetical protein [Clostridiales bacterium]
MADHYGSAVPFHQVKIQDPFWTPRIATNREATLPHEYDMLLETGRLEAFRLTWKPGDQPVPHFFWDSDVAKWVEAASYSLADHPDPELAARLEYAAELIASAQQPDGCLNVYFTVVEPEKRWTNLRDYHELYCAGHLIEAGVAHFEATGKRTLLDAVCRYADRIGQIFGRGEGQLRGYCGHEEIELALVRLYQVTQCRRYLELSRYFIEERGRQPHYFDLEARCRGETETDPPGKRDYSIYQAHQPVREQEKVTGHAVRAMYLYSGMADLARELDDPTLTAACERIWNHLCAKQLYLTGGIGASRSNEGFTDDYELPDASAYCETCAGIGLIFWARRMLQLRCDRKFADVLEKTLYNNVLAGASLDGRKFFYDNPLAAYGSRKNRQGQTTSDINYYQRSEWFGCACCPPNYARLISSLGGYLYTVCGDTASVHLYISGQAQLQIGTHAVALSQQTRYPWDGSISIRVTPETAALFTISLRIPGWCRQYRVQVNGQDWPGTESAAAICTEPGTNLAEDGTVYGYLPVYRRWQPGDELTLTLDMPVRRLYGHPDLRDHHHCVAIQRGPIVYCAEQTDQATPVHRIYLPADSELRAEYCPDLLGGVVRITGSAVAALPVQTIIQSPAADSGRPAESDPKEPLYSDSRPDFTPCTISLIPYYAWNNREPGEMRVWLPQW